MPDLMFNTPPNETIKRETQVVYLNTGTEEAQIWRPLGKRVEDSSAEMDWSPESKQDILGNTYTTLKKPVITQTFEPCELDSNDAALVKLWNLAIKDQNYNALANLDMLRVHYYVGETTSAFAERFPASTINPSSLGGAGGGTIGMPLECTFGGERETGRVSKDSSGNVTYTKGEV